MRTVERKKHLRIPASGTFHGLWLTGTAASPQEECDANASCMVALLSRSLSPRRKLMSKSNDQPTGNHPGR